MLSSAVSPTGWRNGKAREDGLEQSRGFSDGIWRCCGDNDHLARDGRRSNAKWERARKRLDSTGSGPNSIRHLFRLLRRPGLPKVTRLPASARDGAGCSQLPPNQKRRLSSRLWQAADFDIPRRKSASASPRERPRVKITNPDTRSASLVKPSFLFGYFSEIGSWIYQEERMLIFCADRHILLATKKIKKSEIVPAYLTADRSLRI